MESTSICMNGELKPGDLVLSSPDEDYACLVGTVLSINKPGTPEHDAETENTTDAIHVDFMNSDYSENRIHEIEEMFGDLYGTPRKFEDCPIDDTIMSPDTLVRISGIKGHLLQAILDSHGAAEDLYRLVEIGPSAIRDPAHVESVDRANLSPAQAALIEPDALGDSDTAALRTELVMRLDENLNSFMKAVPTHDAQALGDMSSQIGAMADAHYYMTEIHNFHTSELHYLLQFQDPLRVVADRFELSGMDDRSNIMWEIFDRQDALQGGYPLMPEPPAEKHADTQSQLFEQIAKKHCRVETLETRNRDSLDFHDVSVWGLKSALQAAFDAGRMHQRSQKLENEAQKPSVMDRLRDAAHTPKEPHKNIPGNKKSEPER